MSDALRSWTSADEAATRGIGEILGGELRDGGGVLLVEADLGVGKTVLAQGVARALGIPSGAVASPTYTLIIEHRGPRGRFVHVDLYRLEPADVPGTGLEEVLEEVPGEPRVVLVEWPERLPWTVPGARRLRLSRLADGQRRIEELP